MTHARKKIKLVGQLVQELEYKQTNGRTDRHDRSHYIPHYNSYNESVSWLNQKAPHTVAHLRLILLVVITIEPIENRQLVH